MAPRRREISPRAAGAVLVAAVVVVGGAGFALLNQTASSGKSSPPASCAPATERTCAGQAGASQVILWTNPAPGVGQTALTLTQGQSINASVYLADGATASSLAVNWGDGSVSSQPANPFEHSFLLPGDYVVSATATVDGVVESADEYLMPVDVEPSAGTTHDREFPIVVPSLTNGTPSGSSPWLAAGGIVNVGAIYGSIPTAEGYSTEPPSISVDPTSSVIAQSEWSFGANATYRFTFPGIYRVLWTGPIASPAGRIFQNFSWTVFVGPDGVALACGQCGLGGSAPLSPHPGLIEAFEIAPGGEESLDPAVDYQTTGAEVLMNTYETLVNFAGSSTASFVPVLATCVPGTGALGPNSCQSQFGSWLTANGTAGNGEYWTFPISPTAQFFDPSTGAHWGVYPTDVMFSILRDLLWLETPSQYVYNGWVLGQSLLPYQANSSWDGALHSPWNNTPQNMLSSMLINDSAYCPASAMTQDHGCITFRADGSGQLWPYLLDLLQDPEGGSIVSCGWYTAQGAGIPDFPGTAAANGDGPCWVPSGAGQTTTNSSRWTEYVASIPPNRYDAVIDLGATDPYDPQPNVRWSVVGSGPYFLDFLDNSLGYELAANPYYAQPRCVWSPGCYPSPGDYVPNVTVFWDPNASTGILEYEAGEADTAAFFQSDTSAILTLAREGRIALESEPELELYTFGYNLWVNSTLASESSGLPSNVPADFFDDPGLREFLSAAYPYSSSISTLTVAPGIPGGQNVGGVIPEGTGNYYPTNVSWPGYNVTTGTWSDPSTDPTTVGSAAYWWKQISNPTSPYYDAYVANECTKANPCTWPWNGYEYGGPGNQTSALELWGQEIREISGGNLTPTYWTPVSLLVGPNQDGPGQSPLTLSTGAWIADYPDPSDFTAPFYEPNGSYSWGDALGQVLLAGPAGPEGSVLSPGPFYCSGPQGQLGRNFSSDFAALAYWANGPLVTEACQGTADQVMNWALSFAANDSGPAQRALLYNMIEHVANNLALYLDYEQVDGIYTFANWVAGSSVTTNPSQLGQQWYLWSGSNML